MIDLRLAGTVRERAALCRERALQSRAVARQQRAESIQLLWHARRLCFDRYGPVLGMWDGAGFDTADPGSESPNPIPERSRPAGVNSTPNATGRNETVALVPDTAVRHLFGISVELAGVLEISRDPEVVRRIRQIISDADNLIHEIRLASSEPQPIRSDMGAPQDQDGSSAPGVDADPPSERRLAMRLLQEASFAIDRSLTFTRRQAGRAAVDLEVDLEEASWAVHRAIIALTG